MNIFQGEFIVYEPHRSWRHYLIDISWLGPQLVLTHCVRTEPRINKASVSSSVKWNNKSYLIDLSELKLYNGCIAYFYMVNEDVFVPSSIKDIKIKELITFAKDFLTYPAGLLLQAPASGGFLVPSGIVITVWALEPLFSAL